MNRFIVFEGIDSSGKTTQLQLLARRIEAKGEKVVTSREPGGCPVSEKIRELLLNGEDMLPHTEALLFAASRAQHVREVLKPALDEGAHVLLDRYIHSSLAYQVYGRGLSRDEVMAVNKPAMAGLWPGRVFLLDADPEVSLRRMAESGKAIDRMEKGGVSWLTRLRAGYLDLAAHDNRITVLDANRSVNYLHEAIWEIWTQDDHE